MAKPGGPIRGSSPGGRFTAPDRVDPADTRECDGYPGLAAPLEIVVCPLGASCLGHGPTCLAAADIERCCGDPGDCAECGA